MTSGKAENHVTNPKTLILDVILAITSNLIITLLQSIYVKKPARVTCWFFSAERMGFEPMVPFRGTHAFQACQFNHSCISPS